MASSHEEGLKPFIERYAPLGQNPPQRRGRRSMDVTNRFATVDIGSYPNNRSHTHSKKLYKYSPIPDPDRIRLLYLKPAGTNLRELHGSLRLHKLNHHSVYEAISYAWGDFRHLDQVIHLDGKTLKITENLYAALMAYSLPDRVRVLWVDAICINQTDALEKAQQVALMANIFSKASMVQVWLTPASRWATDAMGFLRRLSSRAETFGIGADVGHPRRVSKLPFVRILGKVAADLIYDAIDHHVDFLLYRSWFNRVWVVQEVALATDLVVSCGHTKIPWVDMARALEVLRGAYIGIPGDRARERMKGLTIACSLVRHRDEFRYVDQHLERNHHYATKLAAGHMMNRACTDDRDRVYAMLAMTRSPLEMEPDYTKTVAETYTEFAKRYSPNSQLDFAGLARRQPGRTPPATIIREDDQTCTFDVTDRDYLPSWVPEYRPTDIAWSPSFVGEYATAIDTPFFFLNHPAIPKVMHATGAILDIISTTSYAFSAIRPPFYFSPTFFFPLTTLLNHHLANPPSSFTNPQESDLPFAISLAKTLTSGVADCPNAEYTLSQYSGINTHLTHLDKGSLPWLTAIWTAFATHALSPMGEVYQAILLRTISPLDTEPLHQTTLSPDAQIATGFLHYLADVLVPQRLFTTRGGRIGLAPRMARPGDGLAVVNGCDMPFVVRKVGRVRCEGETEENGVVLIGECYVQGWMRGEILRGRKGMNMMKVGEEEEEEGEEVVKWTRYPGDPVDSLYGWLMFV